MSRIDELIQELCPGGVEYKTLGSIGTWYGGGTPSKGKPEYWTNGTVPWISPKDMGRRVVDSSIDLITEAAVQGSATKLVPPTSVAIVVRSSILDHTFPTALVPVPVALNQDMKALVPFNDVLVDYLGHLLSSRGGEILRRTSKSGGSVTSINTPQLMAFRIPVPPLPVQRQIVRILDELVQLEGELEAELEAELQARRQQYAYYRDSLVAAVDGQAVCLGEVGTFFRGRRFTKNDVVEAGIPSIHYGEIYTDYGVSASRAKREVRSDMANQLRYARPYDVIFAGVGETVEDVGKAVAWLGDGPVAVHDDTFSFTSNLDPKYVAYAVQTKDFHTQKANYVARGKMKRLSSTGLAKITIPVPSLAEQKHIVALLDEFDALVNDLSVRLREELAARRKQYEYHRDKLLTFPEAAS